MKEVVRVWIGNPNEKGRFNGTAFFVDGHTLVTAKHVVLNLPIAKARGFTLI